MHTIRRASPAFGIAASELILRKDEEHGSGLFLVAVEPQVLKGEHQVATVSQGNLARIAVSLHPARGQVIVLLGGEPSGRNVRRVYNLPVDLDGGGACEFRVRFDHWIIVEATCNNTPLEPVDKE